MKARIIFVSIKILIASLSMASMASMAETEVPAEVKPEKELSIMEMVKEDPIYKDADIVLQHEQQNAQNFLSLAMQESNYGSKDLSEQKLEELEATAQLRTAIGQQQIEDNTDVKAVKIRLLNAQVEQLKEVNSSDKKQKLRDLTLLLKRYAESFLEDDETFMFMSYRTAKILAAQLPNDPDFDGDTELLIAALQSVSEKIEVKLGISHNYKNQDVLRKTIAREAAINAALKEKSISDGSRADAMVPDEDSSDTLYFLDGTQLDTAIK